MPTSRTLATLIALPLGFTAVAAPAQELTKEQLATRLNGIEASDITDAPSRACIRSPSARTSPTSRRMAATSFAATSSTSRPAPTSARRRVRGPARPCSDTVDPASMIVFKPANGAVKHTVTIFTDVDCGYCRQFHREIDKVTALGIEVHYLFYPRTGPNTESWTKAEEVWCAPTTIRRSRERSSAARFPAARLARLRSPTL